MSDQTLLALPGFSPGLSSQRMLTQLQQAVPDRASVHGVDLLGLVQRASDSGRDGVEGLAEALGEVVDELGVHRTVVLAEGVGATAALRLAALRPDAVKHLVLCAPYGYAQPLSGSWEPRTSVAATVRDLYLGDETASQAALEMLAGGRDLAPAGLASVYRESAQDEEVADAVRRLAEWMETGAMTPMTAPEGDRVRSSKVPVSLVWGRDDRAAGLDSAFYLNRRLKDVQLRVFGNVGHLVLEQGGGRLTGHLASVLGQVMADDLGSATERAEKVGSGA